MASLPPPTRRATPWYVAMSLVATATFGLLLMMGGCKYIDYYRQPRIDPSSNEWVQQVTREDDKSALVESFSHLDDTLDRAKDRFFPISIAELILGAAMTLFASRAMAGRVSARNLLLQIVVAQGAIAVATHFLTLDIERAQVQVMMAIGTAAQHAKPVENGEAVAASTRNMLKLVPNVTLLFQTLFTALVVLALTRPKARAFFEEKDALSEP
jgi:hypothetical protein